MHILLQPQLTEETIDTAHWMLVDFTAGERECTLNSHLLVHLLLCKAVVALKV